MIFRGTPLRRARGWAAALAAVALATPAARAATPARVQQAIDRGRDYLFERQANGNWEEVQARVEADPFGFSTVNAQWGGTTSLATFALLAAGVPSTEPHVKQAVAFLRGAELKGNYAIGLRAQVWPLLPPEPWVRQAAADDARRLMDNCRVGAKFGPASGLWAYTAESPPDLLDHSVSQFAVLGVWACAQAGADVPTAFWNVTDEAWHRQQQPDGGWGYFAAPREGDLDGRHATGAPMTAAGLATLFIAQEFTQSAARCNGNVADPAIDAGVRFLGQGLPGLEVGRRNYTLFGVSRVGLASGYKTLGGTDWFRFGSDLLCDDQDANTGAWQRMGGNENVAGVPDTAFALLFLTRGRQPLMMAKLRYDVVSGSGKSARSTPGTWNQRPRDVANLARWVGRQLESPLNWQVVGLDDPADDLFDAPLLYLAGGKAPKLSPADVAKLRAYCEDGGLIVGHADCASSDFAGGFRKLGEQLFPGRKFRPLDAAHPIYTNQMFPRGQWRSKPALEGLSNGARELMVLLPSGDPARLWQGASFQPVKTEVAGQLMTDLFLYAVEKEGLRRRGETYLVRRRADVLDAPKAVRVARLKFAGNWDPEPGGWRRLAAGLHNDGVAELTVEPVDLTTANAKLDPARYPLASLTVTDADAALTPAAMADVREYVKAGGTLLLDVAGGRGVARSAAAANLAKLFPDAPHELPVLPPDDPVYTAGGPKLSVAKVDYRRFERSHRNVHEPQLRGYSVGGRTAVLYSPDDLSVGLVGQPIDGVSGYAPGDATKVVTAVIAYAAKLRP